MSATGRPARRSHVHGDDGGFVLTWFAVLLVVLLAFAGFGVDVWNWWYTAEKTQRAADAGALAGVVFMPDDAATAESTAKSVVGDNGYTSGQTTVSQGQRSNQLRVEVTETVTNLFTGLLGVNTTVIKRDAVAEFNGGLKMGSPTNKLGNDPENPPTVEHWLNLAAAGVSKQTGDRFASSRCGGGPYLCPGGDSGTNQEYVSDTYYFSVEVPPSAVGQTVEIQAFDPVYASVNNGGQCTATNLPAAAEITTLTATYPDAAQRYGQGPSIWCTGDDDTPASGASSPTPQVSTFIVREPDATPFQPQDNPPISGCTKQYQGRNQAVFPLIEPSSGSYDATFAGAFHRWTALCSITNAQEGRYFIQVRSNAPMGSPLTPNVAAARSQYGMNRYALRAGIPSGSTLTPGGVKLFAEERLPIYANAINGATPEFYLARVLPGPSAGRLLKLTFYDIGDVGGTCSGGCRTNISVLSPPDATTPLDQCTWKREGAAMPASSVVSGCTVTGMANSEYNGRLITADIKVPSSYSCNVSSAVGCWVKIRMSYTSGTQPNDTTTWQAEIFGDPVRLVE